MYTRFKQYKASTTSQKEKAPANTPRNARSAPIPEVSQEIRDKLDIMLESLIACRGKKYSELSLNEKRLVELFCTRAAVDSTGKSIPKNPTDEFEIFTVLKVSGYAHRFAVYTLQEYFAMPTFQDFHIYEDERMNIDDLYGDRFEYSGHPFLDAVKSWPNQYLPIRASKGKANLFAIWSGRSAKDLSEYTFKERLSVTPNEQLYQNPLLPEAERPVFIVEEPKVVETPSIITKWRFLQEGSISNATSAAIYDIFVGNKDAFVTKYGQELEVDPEFLVHVLNVPRDTKAYTEAIDRYS